MFKSNASTRAQSARGSAQQSTVGLSTDRAAFERASGRSLTRKPSAGKLRRGSTHSNRVPVTSQSSSFWQVQQRRAQRSGAQGSEKPQTRAQSARKPKFGAKKTVLRDTPATTAHQAHSSGVNSDTPVPSSSSSSSAAAQPTANSSRAQAAAPPHAFNHNMRSFLRSSKSALYQVHACSVCVCVFHSFITRMFIFVSLASDPCQVDRGAFAPWEENVDQQEQQQW
jgi:hypothetical protein